MAAKTKTLNYYTYDDGKERIAVVRSDGLGVIVRRERKNPKGRFQCEEECLIPLGILAEVAKAISKLVKLHKSWNSSEEPHENKT